MKNLGLLLQCLSLSLSLSFACSHSHTHTHMPYTCTGSLMLWFWQCSESSFLSQPSCFKGHPPIHSQVKPKWVIYKCYFCCWRPLPYATAGSTVDITVHLEQANELSVPSPPTSVASHKAQPPQPSPSKAPPTSAVSGSKIVSTTPPHSSHSARRNLTRSFEEASLNTPSSKTTAGEDC